MRKNEGGGRGPERQEQACIFHTLKDRGASEISRLLISPRFAFDLQRKPDLFHLLISSSVPTMKTKRKATRSSNAPRERGSRLMRLPPEIHGMIADNVSISCAKEPKEFR